MTATAHIPTNALDKGIVSDEKFPLVNRSLHLAIEVREHDLLACILDKHSNCYVAIEQIPFTGKDKDIFHKNAILASKAASVSVVFTPNSSILVPAPFYKKESLPEYLKLQQLDKENEIPCYDLITSLDSYNLYTVNKDVLNLLRSHYPNASFRHHSSIFIEFVLIENKNSQDNKVFVSVFKSYMDVIVLKSGKLTLYNRFYYTTTADFMYYLLWVYEQMGTDTEKTSCTFYGDINTASETFTLASTYIKKITLGDKNKQSDYSHSLSKLPLHKYRSLFTQYLCV